jgi:uncharacterized protein (DUF697 family)
MVAKTTPKAPVKVVKKAPVKAPTKAPAKKPAVAMDYGYVKSFLDAHPDVAKKVAAAVANGYTSARLQAEIKTTPWWTTRTEVQRQADVLSKDNPAEYQRQVDAKVAEVQANATKMGLSLSPEDAKAMAATFYTNGASAGEMASALSLKFTLPADSATPVTGEAGTTLDDLHSMATAYGVTLDQATAQRYTQQVLSGAMTTQGLQDTFREQAKILYPSVSGFLDKNPAMTTSDYAAPYLQIASKELGVPTAQMDLSDPKWSKVLSNGAAGPMTADEWTRTFRTDPSYGWDKSGTARAQASTLASTILSKFGMMG